MNILPFEPTWLPSRVIYVALLGSRAYGTATPESDWDYRGIAIPPIGYFHGFAQVFEQASRNTPPEETIIFGIKKFFHLAAQANPNVLEILFVEEEDIRYITSLGRRLRECRDLFLSQRAKHTFSGYARSQLNRIKAHRRWLLDPPTAPPKRADFDLPERQLMRTEDLQIAEAEIRKLVDSWELDLSMLDDADRLHMMDQIARTIRERTETPAFEQAQRLIGFDTNMGVYLDKERRFATAKREWDNYQTWKTNRNPARAAIEAKFGVDLKHGAHLVRLTSSCRQLLETGQLVVRRPDAELLVAIRNGAWTYEQLVEYAEREDEALNAVAKASKLPYAPDRKKLDNLCIELVEEMLLYSMNGT